VTVAVTDAFERGTAEAPARVIAAQLPWSAAWERVSTKAGMPGVDGVATRRFSRTVPASLRVLEAQLASGEYRPLPLRLATMAKKHGGTRTLLVPAVRDRVAQTAVAFWLGARWNNQFDAASFAYRPGLGVHAALRHLRGLYNRGCRWVMDADIRACFDSIDHERLVTRLRASLGDRSPVLAWLRACVAAPVWNGVEVRQLTRGVPQGSPLSPLLANFYLDAFDRTLRSAGIPLVRYADDFLVLARTPFDLQEHRRVVEQALDALGLQLNAEKTRTATFDRWFRFVGAEIQGEAILLPFEKPKTKLTATFVAEPMPRALVAAWRRGAIRVAGPFDSTAAPASPGARRPESMSAAPRHRARRSPAIERLRCRP
jgi:group II intron reverse transcriptase/maturase